MGVTDGAARRGYRAGLVGEMAAELLGTFVLIMFGAGAVAVAVVGLPESGRQTVALGPANWVLIVLGWGLAVTFAVYVAGGVSSAHVNPAVTLAFAVRRGFPWVKVLPYWFAQTLGAFLAAALVYAVYRPAIDAYDAANGLASRAQAQDTFSIFATFPAKYFGASPWGPLLDQVVATALLVAVIAAVIDERNQAVGANLGGFVIGLVVVGIGISFGTGFGYAINPARDFGPRLWTAIAGWNPTAFPGVHGSWWIPVVGPLVGGVVGIVVYDLLVGSVLAARATTPLAAPEPPAAPERTAGVDRPAVPDPRPAGASDRATDTSTT